MTQRKSSGFFLLDKLLVGCLVAEYLCQKCWLAMEDCMCSYVKPCGLWNRFVFGCICILGCWQDFLRQNNTGKLLWQIFGVHSATLCIFGIVEDEEIMWNEFKRAGKSQVRCLYPSQSSEVSFSVEDAFGNSASENSGSSMTDEDKTMHVILLDGTWNNSAAMLKRLKEQIMQNWYGETKIFLAYLLQPVHQQCTNSGHNHHGTELAQLQQPLDSYPSLAAFSYN